MATILHLIPTPIAEGNINYLHPQLIALITSIKHWYIEDLKTARRFLKLVNKAIDIDSLQFYKLNEHEQKDIQYLQQLKSSNVAVGLMSDAGCPAVADPGSNLVALAHALDITVMPYVGPSSILLTIMASGFNGQHFAFNGYLPIKQPLRNKALQRLEQLVTQQGSTQLFIETPYRNNQILADMYQCLQPNTQLCIAQNCEAPDARIKTFTLKNWKASEIILPKVPVVFALGTIH
jgi:16S rRNA (cytidine1402-2'-O)-methyltransferase